MSGRGNDRRRTARRLGEDERALFERMMRSVRPLDPADTAAPPPPTPPTPPRQPLPPSSEPGPGHDVAAIDRKTARKIERGRMGIEARLDLHGDDQATAHARLARFIAEQAAASRKSVLVITGKGADGDGPFGEPQRGVLRRQVPMWLAAPGLRRYVVGLRNAARHHGGEGAYYVLLRKPK